MKRIVCLLLTGVLALAMAACGDKPAVSSVDETTSVEESVASEETSVEEEEVPEGSGAGMEIPEMHIKDLFEEHGIKAGTCLSPAMTSDLKAREVIAGQFNSVTMENAMKPDSILNKEKSREAGDIAVEFSDETIRLLDYAKNNGLMVRGHTLVWYSQTPNWIFYEEFNGQKEMVGRDVMLARMESYIKQVFETLANLGYIDIVYAYDVVNEAVNDDGSLRDNKWKETIGDDYIWWAFYYADKYAPESIDLYYNDYNEQYKTNGEIALIESLVTEDGRSLVDGIGLQAHLYTSDNMIQYFSSFDKFAATGLKISLTELDVCLGGYQKKLPNNEDNQKTQGRYYYNLIEGLLERKDNGTANLDCITIWGFMDSMSWRRDQYPVLYNSKYEPKYAYYGVMQEKELAGFAKETD